MDVLKCHQTHLSVCKSALKSSKAAAASISQDHRPHGVRTSWDRVEHKSTHNALFSSSDLQCVNWNTSSFMLVGKWNVRERKWSHKKHLKAHFTTNGFILILFVKKAAVVHRSDGVSFKLKKMKQKWTKSLTCVWFYISVIILSAKESNKIIIEGLIIKNRPEEKLWTSEIWI